MDENQPNGRSHLFLVRLWLDQAGNINASENLSHGKVQHLISGKASHFSDWSSLIDLLASMASTTSAPVTGVTSILSREIRQEEIGDDAQAPPGLPEEG